MHSKETYYYLNINLKKYVCIMVYNPEDTEFKKQKLLCSFETVIL